jgi:hypothetical protein
VIGQPVVVEVLADGSVRVTVDLSDIARPRDVGEQVDWPDEQVDAVCAQVDAAIDAGRFTVGAS